MKQYQRRQHHVAPNGRWLQNMEFDVVHAMRQRFFLWAGQHAWLVVALSTPGYGAPLVTKGHNPKYLKNLKYLKTQNTKKPTSKPRRQRRQRRQRRHPTKYN